MGKKGGKPTKELAAAAGSKEKDNKGKEKKGGIKVKCRHILCEKQGQILKAQELLKEKPFAEVAKEYSIDKARSGGDLGWQLRTGVVAEFAAVAFTVPLNTPSAPFKTAHGWHIVLVEDRK
eukprot:GCRY01007133.1.p2 GENE.GCRY01007133.1~~GCRY01007133.1.p2  ORF type:complete len:132 (+),score=35.67 GCRY01007133.1:36-398(+)